MSRNVMVRRQAAFIVTFLVLLPSAVGAEAQPSSGDKQRAPDLIDDSELAQVNIGLVADVPARDKAAPVAGVPARDKTAPEPLRDLLSREGQFMVAVGELSPEEAESFLREGEKALLIHGGSLIDGAMRFTGTRGVIEIDGRITAFEEPPNRNARRILAAVLKRVSPGAADKFDAESQRLEARRRRAAAIMQVAELDEAVLLSTDQRRKLRAMLSKEGGVPWFPMNASVRFSRIPLPQKSLITAGSLGTFAVSDTELSNVLRAWQLECYEEAGRPMPTDVAIVEQAVRPKVVARGAKGGATAAEAEAEVRLRWQAADEHGIVYRPSVEQRLRLGVHLLRLVEDVAQNGDLTSDQRDKLLLAGKLDNLALCRPMSAEESQGRENLFQEVARVRVARARLPPAILDDAGPKFQKALERQLSEQQKLKLGIAWRERRGFRRQALVEAVVVGFERAAALSSAQCEKLSSALNAALATPGRDAAPPPLTRQRLKSDWQLDSLARIAQLPEENWRSCFFDFQWTAAKRQQLRVAEAARRIEVQAAASAKIRVEDPQGNMIEVDALQADENP